ncbi:AAA domain-containing protein [Mycoplasma procyoni]|uniref:AAA domain-containing protein n=1 Tax=Mycoplasma procyoni TaxID=568784 RepID=UPI00197BD8CF|nr:DEAD/DEAH box helicase [Mycoplasma procyoni]MBN3534564.1 DNA2/NAM7 family helicase [Mycoplasma procyoni]
MYSNEYEIAKKNKDKYKSVLDNLFDLGPNDTSFFVTINEHDFIDLTKLLDEKHLEKVYTNASFRIPLDEYNLKKFTKSLHKATSIDGILELAQIHEQNISAEDLKRFEKDFDKNLSLFIERNEERIQKSNLKWKKFLAKAKAINNERNIWPMQIGAVFVSVELENRKVFAPLFLKEVNIDIENSRPILFSNGELKLNEKLVWLLEKGGFLVDVNQDVSNFSLEELEQTISKDWTNYKIPSLKGLSQKISLKDENWNKNLQFHPGIVLGLFNSFSSYQRKVMEHIIDNDEVDTILDVEFDKNRYKKRIHKTIFEDTFNFIKLNKTNYSQDKATVSALSHNTVIWGPPGTGKSQTISNIIANILFFNKKALVVSQKKAALDVLKSRMNELSPFCLFILNDKNMNKKTFFDPIENLINTLENFESNAKFETLKIIYDDEKKYIDSFKQIKGLEDYENLLETYSFLKREVPELAFDTVETLFQLSKNIDLNNTEAPKNLKKLKIAILEAKQGKKANIFQKFFDKSADLDAEIIYKDLLNYKGNIKELTDKIENIKPENLKDIDAFYNYVFDNKKQELNDGQEIADFIYLRLYKKILKFSEEQRRLYNQFVFQARKKTKNPYKFVLENAEIIKILFPIIISSVDTELSKWSKNEFDYVILDESSQIFIEKAFPILYLGKIKILAGDDKQMQPSSWFATRNVDEETELGDVKSVLSYANYKGVYSVLLDKNYRSQFASLMTFSSKHFYDSKLEVIDKYNPNEFEPIEVFQVDGVWEEKINKVEADFAIQKTKENLDKFEKIILLTLNSTQRDEIENMIFSSHPDLEEAIYNEKLLLKNIENIQGDEADLLIISIAYDKNAALHSTYIARPGGQNALNVAISRAKQKMIIIKSIKAEEIDVLGAREDMVMLKNWLQFLELSKEERTNYINIDSQIRKRKNSSNLISEIAQVIRESDFIKQYNLSIIENYSIGTKNIDIAILDQYNNLLSGFLVDDFNKYNSYEDFIEYKDQNNFLFSKGYNLKQINKLQWSINKEKIVENLKEELNNALN